MADYLQDRNAGCNFLIPSYPTPFGLLTLPLESFFTSYSLIMKQSLLVLLSSLCVLVLNSCSKNIGDSAEDESANQKRATEFQAVINGHSFRLVDFYADKPIDYIDSDAEIKEETDLKIYIKPYLLDDQVVFDGSGGVKIAQNQQKIPGSNDAILLRNYNVSADKYSAYVDYLDYYYNPIKYKLGEYTADGFTIYLDWPGGAKLYSRFQRIN